MTEERAAQIRQAEAEFTKRFAQPTSPVQVMREVTKDINRHAARRAFSDMLYMGRIRYSDPDTVVLVTQTVKHK